MGKYKVIEYSSNISSCGYYDEPCMIYDPVYTFKVVGGDLYSNNCKEIKDVIESIGDPFVTVNVPPNFDTSKLVSKDTKKLAVYCGRSIGKSQYVLNMFRTAMKTTFYPVKVIFHDPATIVFWDDGTKTVVKCQEGDKYDEEMGLALCFTKKALGNKSNFNNVMKKFIPEKEETKYSCAGCKYVSYCKGRF